MILTRRTRSITFVICIFYFLLISGVILSNSIRTTGTANAVTAQLRYIFPQHWAFFTKANSVYTALYFIEQDKLKRINTNKGSAFNSYGFGKQSRILKGMLTVLKRKNRFTDVNNEIELRSVLSKVAPITNYDLSLFKQFKGKKLAFVTQSTLDTTLDSFTYPLKICVIYVPR